MSIHERQPVLPTPQPHASNSSGGSPYFSATSMSKEIVLQTLEVIADLSLCLLPILVCVLAFPKHSTQQALFLGRHCIFTLTSDDKVPTERDGS